MIYHFDDYCLNAEDFTLVRDQQEISLEPRVFDVLVYLVENNSKIISKEELISTLWAGRIISDAALNTCIRSIRRALEDDAKQSRYIRTFPKRGFQFVGKLEPEPSVVPVAATTQPEKHRRRNLWLGTITLLLIIGVLSGLYLVQSAPKEPDHRTTIAVLNFKNIGGSDEQKYFTEGLVEDLVSNLSLYRELFVIARNSSSRYEGSGLDIKQIGRELGAEYIVSGSVAYPQRNMHVSTQLIVTRSAQQVWTTTIDHQQSELWSTPSELAFLIVGQVVPAVVRADVEQNRRKPPEDLDAWALYQKARSLQSIFTQENQSDAIRFAEMALDKDPTLAAAYGVMARAKGNQFFYQWTEDGEHTLAEAIANAETAISLDDNDPGAYAALGDIYRYTGDETRSIANLERATLLNPSDANIKLEYAHTLDWFRHQNHALPVINQALKLSPRDPRLQNMYFYKAHIQFHLFDFKGALATTEKMSGTITNDTWRVYYHLMRAANFAQLGQSTEANENIKQALALNPKLSLTSMRKQFEGSHNHPENRRFWLESLAKAGLR